MGWVGAGGNGAGRAAGSGCVRGLAGLLQVCRESGRRPGAALLQRSAWVGWQPAPAAGPGAGERGRVQRCPETIFETAINKCKVINIIFSC